VRRFLSRLLRPKRGQAMTEVVLIFPIFMFFLMAMAKVFAMLILVQKVEIASYYAARRWQLESHRNVEYAGQDGDGGCGGLCNDIKNQVLKYVGYGTKMEKFLGLGYNCKDGKQVGLKIERTQVWNVVTLTVCTDPPQGPNWMWKNSGFTFEVTKYVPNRDRPIAFVLPGLAG
jgi:hypothetical protein